MKLVIRDRDGREMIELFDRKGRAIRDDNRALPRYREPVKREVLVAGISAVMLVALTLWLVWQRVEIHATATRNEMA